jgi:beta-1,4-mannosyltransferase
MKFFRPAPRVCDGNPIISQLNRHLQERGWEPLDFDFWKISALVRNRKRCKLIHVHWPEGYWRSNNRFLSCLMAFRFAVIVLIGKVLGYKFAWSAHNTIPHNGVCSPTLERLMRHFVLRTFHLTIGLAYNTRYELELAFGTSGREFIVALHGTYDPYPITRSRKEFRDQYGLPENLRLFLVMNTYRRPNKGIDELLHAWTVMDIPENVHLLLTGYLPDKVASLKREKWFTLIEGDVADEEMGNLFGAVDFLLLNYKNITTSGMFFLAVTMGLPVVAPNIPFFQLHSNARMSMLFDANRPLVEQMQEVTNTASMGWRPDQREFKRLREDYSLSASAAKVSSAFDKMVE